MAVSPKLRFEIFKKYHFTCQYCGKKSPDVILELDHVIPKAEGGKDHEENLTCSCWECNRGKGAHPLTTNMSDQGVIKQTISLAEYELRMREYLAVAERTKELEKTLIDRIELYFTDRFDYIPRDLNFPRCLILRAIKTLPDMTDSDLRGYIDYSCLKTREDTRGHSLPVAACKYFCGILKNKITECSENAVSES